MENFSTIYFLPGMNCSGEINISTNRTSPMTDEQVKQLKILSHYLYGLVIPLVCAFGFVGNILNVVIFTKKKNNKILDEVEYCTTICLVALAISDMMFCLCAFPNAFLPSRQEFHRTEFMLYYKMYSIAIISVFIMSSTMFTLLTAFMRYLAICHPFMSRKFISTKATVSAIVVLSLVSCVFNLPALWRYKTRTCFSDIVEIMDGDLFKDIHFEYAYKLLWAIFGNFIPLAILLYCNIRLIKGLHQSNQLRLLHSRDDTSCLSAHRRINITLVTIIILFFLLVAPSEITKFILLIVKRQKKDYYTFMVVSLVTNTLQTINFSVNFILYYVIIAPFRRTFHEFVCALTRYKRSTDQTRDRSSNTGKQTIMLLSVKEQNHFA